MNGPAFTSHVMDSQARLVYMQARWYANNNPYTNIDPDGREAGTAYSSMYRYQQGIYPQSMSSAEIGILANFTPVVGDIKGFVDAYNAPSFANIAAAVVGLAGPAGDVVAKAIKGADKAATAGKEKGNAIVTPPGGKIEGSPDGRFIQAKDANGHDTGVRIDGGTSRLPIQIHERSSHTDMFPGLRMMTRHHDFL